jgi:hypothetical protein
MEEQGELLVCAIGMIERIGFIADYHVDELMVYKGDAAQWFLPPLWHADETGAGEQP